MPLFDALRELVFEREEEGGVQRGEAACLRFREALVVDLGERVGGLRFLYNSYKSALVDLRGAWMSELDRACLKLATVHCSIGGSAGLVDRYDDAGELAWVPAGEGEMEPGRFGGRVARRVAGLPRDGTWGSIAWLRVEKLDLEPIGCGDAIGEEDSSPDEEVPIFDMVRRRADLMLFNRQLDGGKTAVFMSQD